MVYLIIAIIFWTLVICYKWISTDHEVDVRLAKAIFFGEGTSSTSSEINECMSGCEPPLTWYKDMPIEDRLNILRIMIYMARFAEEEKDIDESSNLVTKYAILMGLEPIKSLLYCEKYKIRLNELLELVKNITDDSIQEKLIIDLWDYANESTDSTHRVKSLSIVLAVAESFGYSSEYVTHMMRKLDENYR